MSAPSCLTPLRPLRLSEDSLSGEDTPSTFEATGAISTTASPVLTEFCGDSPSELLISLSIEGRTATSFKTTEVDIVDLLACPAGGHRSVTAHGHRWEGKRQTANQFLDIPTSHVVNITI